MELCTFLSAAWAQDTAAPWSPGLFFSQVITHRSEDTCIILTYIAIACKCSHFWILAGLTSIFWSIKMSIFTNFFAPKNGSIDVLPHCWDGSHRPRWTWMAWSAVPMPPPPSRCRRSSPAPCGRWCLTTMPGSCWLIGALGFRAPKFGGLKLLIQQNWDVPTKRSCWLGVGVTVQLYMGFSDLCIEFAETRRVGEKNGL